MSEYKKLYVAEYPDGTQSRNYATGTKFYTRLGDALKRLCRKSDTMVVVEYELVPTGVTHKRED